LLSALNKLRSIAARACYVAQMTAGPARVGVKWGQGHKKQAARHVATAAMNSKFVRAGGTGIAPAPCGCGACCRSFSYVHGRTRAGLKWPILMAQSVRTFTRVPRRWGQQWGQNY
jgi:hypothetical protein